MVGKGGQGDGRPKGCDDNCQDGDKGRKDKKTVMT